MPIGTPEETIQDGICNRLTHVGVAPAPSYGLTVAAGQYCSNEKGVQRFAGDVSLDVDGLIEWAKNSLTAGPVVLIVVGGCDYDTDKITLAIGEFEIHIYVACANYRSTYEVTSGDAAADARQIGLWQVKADVLDRLMNFAIINGESPAWPTGGRLIRAERGLALYELTMKMRVARLHSMVPWSTLSPLTGIDVHYDIQPDSPANPITESKVDIPPP